jgi:hypothetical protein
MALASGLKDTKHLEMVDNIVNAVTARKPLYGLPLLFEVQIFGGVDILTDVTEVHLGHEMTSALEAAVRNFYQGTRVSIVKAGAAPADGIQTSGSVDPWLMAALVHSTNLDTPEKAAIDRDKAAATTASPQYKELMKNAMTVLESIKKIATANPEVLTGVDFANLDNTIKRISALAQAPQFTPADQAAMKSRIEAQRRAPSGEINKHAYGGPMEEKTACTSPRSLERE